jgi:hypothetical protein
VSSSSSGNAGPDGSTRMVGLAGRADQCQVTQRLPSRLDRAVRRSASVLPAVSPGRRLGHDWARTAPCTSRSAQSGSPGSRPFRWPSSSPSLVVRPRPLRAQRRRRAQPARARIRARQRSFHPAPSRRPREPLRHASRLRQPSRRRLLPFRPHLAPASPRGRRRAQPRRRCRRRGRRSGRHRARTCRPASSSGMAREPVGWSH